MITMKDYSLLIMDYVDNSSDEAFSDIDTMRC